MSKSILMYVAHGWDVRSTCKVIKLKNWYFRFKNLLLAAKIIRWNNRNPYPSKHAHIPLYSIIAVVAAAAFALGSDCVIVGTTNKCANHKYRCMKLWVSLRVLRKPMFKIMGFASHRRNHYRFHSFEFQKTYKFTVKL